MSFHRSETPAKYCVISSLVDCEVYLATFTADFGVDVVAIMEIIRLSSNCQSVPAR